MILGSGSQCYKTFLNQCKNKLEHLSLASLSHLSLRFACLSWAPFLAFLSLALPHLTCKIFDQGWMISRALHHNSLSLLTTEKEKEMYNYFNFRMCRLSASLSACRHQNSLFNWNCSISLSYFWKTTNQLALQFKVNMPQNMSFLLSRSCVFIGFSLNEIWERGQYFLGVWSFIWNVRCIFV